MARTKTVLNHVRGATWGLPGDLDFLERLASELNGIGEQLRLWGHLSGRQPDAALSQRLSFGSALGLSVARANAAQQYGALCAARAILEPSLPLVSAPTALAEETVKRFRRLEGRHPARLSLVTGTVAISTGPDEGKGVVHAMFSAPRQNITVLSYGGDARGATLAVVWWLLGMRERDRLKRCARCRAWFVDRMRSKRKVWCSPTCHDAAWNRAQRRGAAHAQYSRRRPAKGRRGGRR